MKSESLIIGLFKREGLAKDRFRLTVFWVDYTTVCRSWEFGISIKVDRIPKNLFISVSISERLYSADLASWFVWGSNRWAKPGKRQETSRWKLALSLF